VQRAVQTALKENLAMYLYTWVKRLRNSEKVVKIWDRR